MASTQAHYKVLGLDQTATQDQVRAAYKKMAILCHPDKNHNDPGATARFQSIVNAYEILTKLKDREAQRSHPNTQDRPQQSSHERHARSEKPQRRGAETDKAYQRRTAQEAARAEAQRLREEEAERQARERCRAAAEAEEAEERAAREQAREEVFQREVEEARKAAREERERRAAAVRAEEQQDRYARWLAAQWTALGQAQKDSGLPAMRDWLMKDVEMAY